MLKWTSSMDTKKEGFKGFKKEGVKKSEETVKGGKKQDGADNSPKKQKETKPAELTQKKSYEIPAKLSVLLECPICLNTDGVPKRLTCGHSVCEECLQKMRENSVSLEKKTLDCPLCRNAITVSDTIGELPNNTDIMKLRETLSQLSLTSEQPRCENCENSEKESEEKTATHYCRECADYFCDSCANEHTVADITGHKALPIHMVVCVKHSRPLSYYCDSDECCSFMCNKCVFMGVCKGHKIKTLDAKKETEVLNDMKDMSAFISGQVRSYNKLIDEYKTRLNTWVRLHDAAEAAQDGGTLHMILTLPSLKTALQSNPHAGSAGSVVGPVYTHTAKMDVKAFHQSGQSTVGQRNTDVAIMPDGRIVLVDEGDGKVWMLDMANGKVVESDKLFGIHGIVYHVHTDTLIVTEAFSSTPGFILNADTLEKKKSLVLEGEDATTGKEMKWQCHGIAVLDDGSLVVVISESAASLYEYYIGVFDKEGKKIHLWNKYLKPDGVTKIEQAFYVTTHGDTIFLSLTSQKKVVQLTKDGGFVKEISTTGFPKGLKVRDNHVLVAEWEAEFAWDTPSSWVNVYNLDDTTTPELLCKQDGSGQIVSLDVYKDMVVVACIDGIRIFRQLKT